MILICLFSRALFGVMITIKLVIAGLYQMGTTSESVARAIAMTNQRLALYYFSHGLTTKIFFCSSNFYFLSHYQDSRWKAYNGSCCSRLV